MQETTRGKSPGYYVSVIAALMLVALSAGLLLVSFPNQGTDSTLAGSGEESRPTAVAANGPGPAAVPGRPRTYQPRLVLETSAFFAALAHLRWPIDASLEQIRDNWKTVDARMMEELDRALPPPGKSDSQRLHILLSKAALHNFLGEPRKSYDLLTETRSWVEKHDALAEFGLYTVIFFQGVAAMRLGETENCVLCRGDSSCIVPISASAVHAMPEGSRLAARHFHEYLEQFPEDLGIRWLLNVAQMTLGEHPQKVDSRFVLPLEHFVKSEFDIGKFRDIGHAAGVDRENLAGGAVFDDFDGDGRLDLATTSFDPAAPMAFYRNTGDGTFEPRASEAGLAQCLGGKYLVQTDYNNDGRLDLFISRGAWFLLPMPQTLLRNDGGGKFTDVTNESRLTVKLNSTSSRWADYDNDGWLDVLILGERPGNRLYHNRGDGTFEDVTARALTALPGIRFCKGADWLDYDNDDFPDLFVNHLTGDAALYHNNRDGTFTNVTSAMGINGPTKGFSCWAWDYDNDGWLDIFASCFDYTLDDIVRGIIGQAHKSLSNRLFRNVNGKKFEDKTREAGLDLVFAAMGSNFGDLDNDGYLDFYLGTGDPDLSTLVPNRMFRNVAGQRFAEITGSARTGHLQKGHGVSFADWDNDGDVDVFIETGGAVPGDRFRNLLFQNPGQGNNWLKVKLVGKKTNRAAMGARIKIVTAGEHPLTIHRHVSTGSSWGANPLQQHIGLARADRVERLEIHWPTSGTTQVFKDVKANQAIEVTEFETDFKRVESTPIPEPK